MACIVPDSRFLVTPGLYVILALAILLLPIQWVLAWCVATFVHELGHYLAIVLCGGKVHEIRISSSGVYMHVQDLSGFRELISALAGPLLGLSLLLVARWLPRVAVCAFVQSAYNLLPIYPLDGGRVIRCILRMHPWKREKSKNSLQSD